MQKLFSITCHMHRLNNVVAVSSSCVCVSSMKRNSEIDRIEEIVGRDTKKVCIAKSIVIVRNVLNSTQLGVAKNS